MTVYTVEVNSTEVEFDKVRVNWVAENGKLATFSTRLTDKTQSVSTGDDVDVKRDGTIIFSGILETIEEEISPSGVFRIISGRHIGVRVWARWIEKYTEKIGLGGFWMNNYPHKIAQFFLRPTKSDYPVKNLEYDRLKSGWGIAYDGKTATSSGAATNQEAEYVMSRDNHLGWISSSGSQNSTWVEVDLKQNYTTSGIRVDTRNINTGATNPKEAGYPFFPRGYTIQTKSSIGSWVTRATQSFNHAQNIIESWAPATTRYVRVNGTRSTSFPMEISEIYVYETDNTIADITTGSLATHLPWNCSYLSSNAGGGATTVNVQDGHLFTEGDDCLIRDTSGTEEWCEVESVSGNVVSISTNHSGGGGLTNGYTTGNGAYLMNLTDGPSLDLEYMRISEALTKVCALTIDPSTQRPWEWWVNNDGSVDMGVERGDDVSGSVGFEYGVKILQSSNKEDIRQRLDRVLVIGKAPKNATSDFNTSGFVDDGGIVEYEAVISDSTLETPASTRVKAEAMLAESELDENKVTAAVDDTYATNTWGIADTITLTDANTGLSGTYRVMGLSRVYSAGSGEIVTIQGDSIDPDAADYIADANKRIKAEESRTQYEDQWGYGTQSGYNLIFECEDLTKDNNTSIEINSEASNYQEIKRTSGSGAGRVLGGPGVKLLVGEYRISYRLKVASNVSTDDFVTIGVYTKEKTGGAGYLAEQTLQPAMFTTDDTYQEMGFSFVVDTDYTDIEFRIDGFVTGVTDLYGDYITLATNYIIDIPGTPTTVTNLVATAAPLSIQLTWDDLDELDLSHYMIYRNETGDPVEEFYTKSVANAYVDSAVSIGVTYYYTVKGQDWAGNLSPEFSNIASAQPNYITPTTDIEPGTITGDLLEQGIQPYEADITFYVIEAQAGVGDEFNIDVNNGIGGCDITASSGTWADFTVGDEVLIASAENGENNTPEWSTQVKTISSKTLTKITLNSPISGGVDNVDDEFMYVAVHDGIRWVSGSPTITFFDTDTHDINSGTVNGLGAGWDYLYFDMALTPPDDEEMQVTGIYDDVIGSERGLLCKIQTSNTQSNTPLIIPFKSRGQNINVDAIAAQSIDTRALSATAIIGKKFYTTGRALDTPSVGIEFDDAGIQAYSGETTKTFELETVTGQVRVYGADGAFQIWDANFPTETKLGELRGNAGVLSIQGVANTTISLNTLSGALINLFDTDSGNMILAAGGVSGEIQVTSHVTPAATYSPYIGTATAPFLQVHAAHGYFSTGVTLTNTAYPADDDHAATKKYVDDQVSAGITYLDPVKDKYDPSGGLPGSPSTGDRWISEATANGWTENYIYEWQAGWTNPDGAPTLGDTVFATDTGETWNYNGAEWVLIASAVNHNSLANIQGGDSTNRWHLDGTAYGWMDTGGPLNTIAGLTPTLDNFIVGTGTTWALKTPADAADSMGLGTGSSPTFTNLTLTGLVPPIGGVVWAGTGGTLFTTAGFEWELATGTLTTDKIIAEGGSLTNMSTLTFTPIGSTKDVGDVVIRARQFYPDTTGTFISGLAPFTVVSTKKVTNLNVDFFDDLDSDQFLRSDVSDAVTGGSTTSWTGVSSDGQLYNSAGDFWIDSTGYGNAVVLYTDDGGVQIESNSIPFLKIWDDISTADTGVDVMDGSFYFHGLEIIEWFASDALLTDGGLVIDLTADNFYGALTFDHGGIGTFVDPDEDRVVFWNDGVTGFGTLITGNTMKITSDTLNVDETVVPLLAQANQFTAKNSFTEGLQISDGDGTLTEGLWFGDDNDVAMYWSDSVGGVDSLIMELATTKEFIIQTPGVPDKIAQFDPAVGVTLFDGAGNAVLEASTNVTVSADLIPNGSQNLGLATAEWANLYLGTGRVYFWVDQEESIRSTGSNTMVFGVGGVDAVWMTHDGTIRSMRVGAEDLGTLGGELILSGAATGFGQEGGKISLEMGGAYDFPYNEWEIQVWEDDLIINLPGGEASPFILFDPAGTSVNFGGKHIYSTSGNIGAIGDKWANIYLSGDVHAIDGTLTITDIDMTGDISIGIGGTVDGVDIGAHVHNTTDGSQKVSHDDLTVASVSEDDHHNRQHSLSDTSDHSGSLPVSLGGTGNAGFVAGARLLVTNATPTTGALVELGASSQGNVLIGTPGGAPSWGDLIGDTGITVTYDTGDLDISVNASEISHGDLGDLITGDPHTQYVEISGDTMTGDLIMDWDSTVSHSIWFESNVSGEDWEIYANTANLIFYYHDTTTPKIVWNIGQSAATYYGTLTVDTLQTSNPVGVIYGGTGLDIYAQGDILYASGTTTIAKLAKNITATRYLSNTGSSNNPAWAQVDLSNGVTGLLTLSDGGTGSDLSPGPADDDVIMFWDESADAGAGLVTWLYVAASNALQISGTSISVADATTTLAGAIEIATAAEVAANTVTDKAIVPADLDSIDTLGTITTGVWDATEVGVDAGGTGLNGIAAGATLWTSATNTITAISPTAINQVMYSSGAGPPFTISWGGVPLHTHNTYLPLIGGTMTGDIIMGWDGGSSTSESIWFYGTPTTGTDWEVYAGPNNFYVYDETNYIINATSSGGALYGTWTAGGYNILTTNDTGISIGKIPDMTSGASDDDYAKFTATGLEGRTYTEVKTDLSLNNVENTALSTWAGSAYITTLGTITTGEWGSGATTIAIASGGTGATSFNTNRVIIMGASALTEAGAATNDYIFTGSAGAPQWEQLLGGTGINVNNASPDFTISIDSTVLTTAGGWEMQGDIIMDWDISDSHSIWFDTDTLNDWEIKANTTNLLFYYGSTPTLVWNIGSSAATYYGALTVGSLVTTGTVDGIDVSDLDSEMGTHAHTGSDNTTQIAHANTSGKTANDHHVGFVGLEDDIATPVTPNANDRILFDNGTAMDIVAGTGIMTFNVVPSSINHSAINDDETTQHFLQSEIVEVGDVGTGTWEADKIEVGYGGTGNAGFTASNRLLVTGATPATSPLVELGAATTNYILTGTAGAPAWQQLLGGTGINVNNGSPDFTISVDSTVLTTAGATFVGDIIMDWDISNSHSLWFYGTPTTGTDWEINAGSQNLYFNDGTNNIINMSSSGGALYGTWTAGGYNILTTNDKGISTGNVPPMSSVAVDNDYAKFTATGLEGRTYSEVKTDLSLNNVENTALSTWTGSTYIATVGTITAGTWTSSNKIGAAYGGTGANLSTTTNRLVVTSGGAVMSEITNSGTGGQILVGTGGAPSFQDLDGGTGIDVTYDAPGITIDVDSTVLTTAGATFAGDIIMDYDVSESHSIKFDGSVGYDYEIYANTANLYFYDGTQSVLTITGGTGGTLWGAWTVGTSLSVGGDAVSVEGHSHTDYLAVAGDDMEGDITMAYDGGSSTTHSIVFDDSGGIKEFEIVGNNTNLWIKNDVGGNLVTITDSGGELAGTWNVVTALTVNSNTVLTTVYSTAHENDADVHHLALHESSHAYGQGDDIDSALDPRAIALAADTVEYELVYKDKTAGTLTALGSDLVPLGYVLTNTAGGPDWQAGSVVGVINDLTDVVISGTPADNEVLAWNTGTSKWINQTASEADLFTVSGHTTAVHNALDITELGTVTSGIWDATTIGVTEGGTGLGAIAAGGMLWSSGSNTLTLISPTGANQILVSSGGGAPYTIAWGSVPTHSHSDFLAVAGDSMEGALTMGDSGTQTYSIIFDGNTTDWYVYAGTTNFYISTSDVTPADGIRVTTAGGILYGTWAVGNITTGGTVDGVDVGSFKSTYDVHDHGVGDPTQVTYSTLLSIPNTFIPIQHALNSATYHSGDLAYSQLDANINIIGTGQADKISRGDHGHTGADGSDQVSWANSISGKPTTFAPTDHATEHHVGGGDLVNHDSLTGFSSTEHFTQSAITTVGTVTTGIWDATAILADKGGTGLTALGAGVMLVGNATTTMATLAAPTITGQMLVSTGAAVFGWTTTVPTHAHTEFLEVDGGNSMVGNLGMSDAGTSSYHIIFTEGITYTWDLYSVASNFYITSDTTDGIFISTTGGTLRGEWTAGGTGVDFNVGGDIVMQATYTVDGVDVSAHAGDSTIHFTAGSISHDSIADVSIDDHHARDHASEHEVGGGDLVGHDSLTGFSASEHFAKTDIDAIDPTVGSGLVKSTSGVLSAVTDGSTNWNAAYSHVSNDGSDHSYINQAVATTSSPSFQALTLTTDLAVSHGGTGFSTIGVGKIVYASLANTLSGLDAPTVTNQMLVSTGAGAAFGWTTTIPTHSHSGQYLPTSGGTMAGNILMNDSGTQSYNIRFNEGVTTWYMWTSSGTMYITTDSTTPVGDGIQLATAGSQVNGALTVTGALTAGGYSVLTTNNEGHGNNLDADTVDTYEATDLFNVGHANVSGVLGGDHGGTGANLSATPTGAIFRWTVGNTFGILDPVGTGSVMYSSSADAWDVLLAGSNTNVLTMVGGVPTWQPPAAGGVTSVSAGNGMNFTTITSTGAVTLGTPTSVTQASTNSVTTTSHSHQWSHTSTAGWDAAASASHSQSHTLNDTGVHSGDLNYSQLDSIVDIVGGGSSTLISRANHVHTGADGSTALTTLGTVTTGNINAIADYYTNADVDARLASPGLGLDYSTGTISLDLSELIDMTAVVVGTIDELIVLDAGLERRKRFSEITLSDFNDDITDANWDLAYTHISQSGASHTYINQSVTTSASPTFSYVNVSNQIRHNGDLNTLIAFTTDNINMVAGGMTLVQVHEALTDSYVRLNDDNGESVRTRLDGLIFGGDSTLYIMGDAGNNDLELYSTSGAIRLAASTYVYSETFLPEAASDDLGTSGTPWDNLYCDGVLCDDVTIDETLKIPVGTNMY